MSYKYVKIFCILLAVCFSGCSDDSTDGKHNSNHNGNHGNTGNIDSDDDEEPRVEVDKDGKCIDKSIKEEPGVCGCQFEDKDIDDDGTIDCPVLVIPQKTLPKLEDIPGKCAEWDYPEHHDIELPDLPKYGYEVTIDTEKYKISKVYDISKAEETTKGFTQALKDYKEAGYTRIVIPPGHYPITTKGIQPPDYTAIIMSDDVILQIIPNQSWDCKAITVSQRSHIYIEGGTIVGDKYEHTPSKEGSSDEECNAINALRSHHIFINGVTIRSTHGDGIMIVDWTRLSAEPINSNITIANCDIDDVFRNGIAIVGCDGIRITGNHIHHTKGTAPQFGIDFEATSASHPNKRVIVDHNTFNDNYSGDLIIDSQNTFIEYNSFSQGDLESQVDNHFIPRATSSTFIFYRNKVLKPVKNIGCSSQLFCSYGYNYDSNKTKIMPTLEQQPYPSYFVENDIPNSRIQLTFRHRLCIKDNVIHEGHMSASSMENLRLINNRVEKFTDNANVGDWSFHNVKGQATGNVTCKLDNNGKEVCTEVEKLKEMKDNELFNMNTQWY